MLKIPSAIEKPSSKRVAFQRSLRYLKVGAFLHVMSFVSTAILFISARIAIEFFGEGLFVESSIWGAVALWALTIPFFSQFDAYGRYQNYKQIKDALFEMGYDSRLITPFMYSKCQRDAVIIAGDDLGNSKEIRAFFREQGYRWYHVLPDAFVKNPLVLFYGLFWKRILFTKHYELKNFFW
jgi:hypothetical protein